jgi:SAM-dependent methyltransferase
MAEQHAAATYVEAITAGEADRRARKAFQDLVLRIATPGAVLFDFGAGPGLDVKFYAEHGFTVGAYDVDPAMRDYFQAHCLDLIRDGRVTLAAGSYQEFVSSDGIPGDYPIDLVTSNFAPLNLIEDLQPLFARLHRITAPEATVLASVLSPYFIGDMKYGWWWRNAFRLWRAGRYSVAGAKGPIVRRSLADFAQASEPHFTLERVFPGAPSLPGYARGIDVRQGGGRAWVQLTQAQYMFLLFRKCARRV